VSYTRFLLEIWALFALFFGLGFAFGWMFGS
jgi:hypothetical protein